MAKKAKAATKRSNRIGPEAVPFIEKALAVLEEKASHAGRFKVEQKVFNKRLEGIITQAKNEVGLPKGVFKTHLKVHDLHNKIEGLETDLDIDERDLYRQLREALGPLGAAAADAVGVGEDDDDSGDVQQDGEPAAAGGDPAMPEIPEALARPAPADTGDEPPAGGFPEENQPVDAGRSPGG